MATFLSIFPRKIGLDFVTKNFTTFFTVKKETCHLELTLPATEQGVITKGFSSLEESLESLKSLNSLESLENGPFLP